MNTTVRSNQHIDDENSWHRKENRTCYRRFLRGERLTIEEAVRARCFECLGDESSSSEVCFEERCPLYSFSIWTAEGLPKH